MVVLDVNSEDWSPKIEQEPLMSKYRIPVQHFEYSYIEKCTDGKELERILQVLRSGEEGYFPDLTQFAENRLAIVKPKSKLLRKICPVLQKEALSREERNELTNDLTQWVENVSKADDELISYKNRKCERPIPEVREIKHNIIEEGKKTAPKRISSTDYSSWDKYDVDTEILKMDLEEENLKKVAVQKEKKKTKNKKIVQFKEFTTDVEALHEANYEKDKGNEFFKAGDYKTALKHYTNSINCKPTLPSFTNRALTNIKLKNYKNAIDDCHSALAIDPCNVKALLRKAQGLEGLGRCQEALETMEQLIETDPNNAIAQDLADKFRKQCGVVLKNTRFMVQDLSSHEETKSNKRYVKNKKSNGKTIQNEKGILKNKEPDKTIIPIPGTSSMSPPYYISCSKNSSKKVQSEALRTHSPIQIIHLVPNDNSDLEDDDCCTVNHLKDLCSVRANSTILKNDSNKECNSVRGEDIKLLEGKVDKENRNRQVMKEDKHAGGEPCIKSNENVDIQEDIHSPYSFLKAWNSANADSSLEQHASILKSIDVNRIENVIGCKLDNTMFSTIIKCLCMHFAVAGEVERLHLILENIVNLPRFDIISMLMSTEDRNYINVLVDFLRQHGKNLPQNVVNKLFNK